MGCLLFKESKLNFLENLKTEGYINGRRELTFEKDVHKYLNDLVNRLNLNYDLNLKALATIEEVKIKTGKDFSRDSEKFILTPIEESFEQIDNRRKELGIYEDRISIGEYNKTQGEKISNQEERENLVTDSNQAVNQVVKPGVSELFESKRSFADYSDFGKTLSEQEIINLKEEGNKVTAKQFLESITPVNDFEKKLKSFLLSIDLNKLNNFDFVINNKYQGNIIGLNERELFEKPTVIFNSKATNKPSRYKLHEFLHSLLDTVVNEEQEFRTELITLFDYVKTLPEFKNEYGVIGWWEFYTEGMTNPDFQAKLKNVTLSGYKGGKKSNVYEEFVTIINSLLEKLGFVNKDYSALDEIINATTKVIEKRYGYGIKPGVQELFESNSELANKVYEALGFNNNVVFETERGSVYYLNNGKTKRDKKTSTGRIEKFSESDKTVYITEEDFKTLRENSEGIKDLEWSNNSVTVTNDFNRKTTISVSNTPKIGLLPLELVKGIDETETGYREDKRINIKSYSFLPNGVSFHAGHKIVSINPQITPQQKQQAQQLYSQYLQQNPNGSVEQFKNWVEEFNRNKSNLDQQSQDKTVNEIYKENPYLENFINSITDQSDDISIYKVKNILDKHGEGRIVKLNKILYNAINRLWDNNIFAKNNIKIKFVDSLPENAVGNFNRDDNEITIDKRKFLNNVINNDKSYPIFYLGYILNHEIIHYLTPKDLSLKIEYADRALEGRFGNTFELEHERKFGKNIKELYDIAIKELSNDKDYGLVNLAEFVAEAMSNPSFQEKLASIPFKSSKQSLWKRFVEILSAYLSLDTKKPITDTLLEAVIAETTNYITENSNIQRTYKRRNSGKTESIDIGYDFLYTTQKNITSLSDFISQKSQENNSFQQFQQSLNNPNTNPILQGNQKEQVKKFAELQERLNNKEFLEGAKFAFESSEELQQFGTQEEYNSYIARVSLGIIKNPSSGDYNYNSKVKDIVYHGTNAKFEQFKPIKPNFDTLNSIEGIYNFSTNKKFVERYGNRIITAILNIKNPIRDTTSGEFIDDMDRPLSEALFKTGKQKTTNILAPKYDESLKNTDGVINSITGEEYIAKHPLSGKEMGLPKQDVVTVFEPEQIYVLGGKNDIQGFKEFVQEEKDDLKPFIDESNKVGEQIRDVENIQETKPNKQLDLFDNNAYYQLPKSREKEEYVASEKTIRDLAARMSDRIGIPVRFESDRTKDYKGKLENGTAVINLAYATLDTPIHEILGHPIIRAIKNRSNYYKEGDTAEFHGYGDPERVTITKIFDDTLEVEFRDSNGNIQKADLFELTKTQNTLLYQNLLKELEYGKGKEVLDRIKRDYVYKFNESDEYLIGDFYYNRNGDTYTKSDANDAFGLEPVIKITEKEFYEALPKYTLEEQQEEAIVELLGLMTAEKLDAVKDGKLISLLKRLLKEIKAFMKDILFQKEVEIDKLPDNMTLGDIANLLAYSNSKLILPGYEVEYTTPDNMKFKTYQEASNHISELAKSVQDVDLSDVSIPKTYWVTWEEMSINHSQPEDPYQVEHYNKDFMNLVDAEKFVEDLKNKTGRTEYHNIEIKESNISFNHNSFIEKNKEYEQSKEIIEEWKKVNNIQYNPEEIYSRGQEFSSVVGAYSSFDVNLMMQNLLSHIEDNEKAGGKFAISAFTKPIDKTIGHLEGGGGKIKFKIYPQSKDILWAANTDVYSGSVWDASEKVNKDKKSELLGVSYTKYPSLNNINSVQPNLASIVDDLSHHHNELAVSLNFSNFEIEVDEDVPYQTKKIIENVNKILQQKRLEEINNIINKLEKEC